MNEHEEQILLDEVAASYCKAGLIRIEAAQPEDLDWINGRLCVRGTPIVRMPVILADTLGLCSAAFRVLLLGMGRDRWTAVFAGNEDYEYLFTMLKPFDAVGGLERFGKGFWFWECVSNLEERNLVDWAEYPLARIKSDDPERYAWKGNVRFYDGKAQRKYVSIGLEAVNLTLGVLGEMSELKERLADSVIALSREQAKTPVFCFAPSFVSALQASAERLYETALEDLDREVRRCRLEIEYRDYPDHLEWKDGRLFFAGDEITDIEPLIDVRSKGEASERLGFLARGKVSGRSSPLYFGLSPSPADRIFGRDPFESDVSWAWLLTQLVEEIHFLPTDSACSGEFFAEFLERAVLSLANLLRSDAADIRTEFQEG